jgi:hypothetical protein
VARHICLYIMLKCDVARHICLYIMLKCDVARHICLYIMLKCDVPRHIGTTRQIIIASSLVSPSTVSLILYS